MAPKFGTSGLRGLVVDLTDDLVARYVAAFAASCPTGGAVHVGRDLRPSSPRIARAVLGALAGAGLEAVDCGELPTPALALHAMKQGAGAVMVTGSHIPADRNGLKFYTPSGEIAKADEQAILAAVQAGAAPIAPRGTVRAAPDAAALYARRYLDAFGPRALAGLRIGLYQHSSVARDLLAGVLAGCGAQVVLLARSDAFIPVDTEAVDPQTRALLARWCADHALDALVSTDGDADRPMVADASGRIVPGDVLGALTARALGARVICTPVSSNSMIAQMPGFDAIRLTRIGSPFVIAAMKAEPAGAQVVGYEANGGFLLGFAARGPAGPLAPLVTRDCLLPILAPLAEAARAGVPLADLVAALPPRFTAADRLQDIDPQRAGALVARLSADHTARAAFFAGLAPVGAPDLTDGLRQGFAGGEIVHLRPSGNAPEFRCYAEAASPDRAGALVRATLERARAELG